MALIADGLMIAASLVAAIYCMVLSSRVRRLKDLDRGLGAAIAGLSHQVDGMQGALEQAKRISGSSVRELRDMTARAEVAAGRLELLLASIHDRDGVRPVTRPKRESGTASSPRDALRRETDGRDALRRETEGRDALRRETDGRDETRRETGLRETGLREGLRAAAPVAQRRSMAQPVTLTRFETDEDEAEAEDRLQDRDGRDEAAALPEDVFRLADTPALRGPAPAQPAPAQPALAQPAPVPAGADQPARVPLALRPRPPASAPVSAPAPAPAAAAAPAPLPSPAAEVADLRRSLRAILGKADA